MKIKDEDYEVIVEAGMLFLTYKGERLPNQMDLRFRQTMTETPCVTVTIRLKSQPK